MARSSSYLNRPASGIILLLAALALPAPASGAKGVRLPSCPGCNLILISLSNVGAGRMSLYGYPRKTTPGLDRWARKAVVFENAFTPASWTLPVGVSLFTSLQPYSHGVLRRNLENSLSPDLKTLPEVLRDRGYRTAAFTGGLDYYPGFSHMRGFQTAPDNGEFAGFHNSLPQAEAWLKENGKDRFFLFLHGYEAHCPFSPSQEFRGRFSRGCEKSAFVDPDFCIRGYEESPTSPDGSVEAVFSSGTCSGFRTRCDFGPEVRLSRRDIACQSDIYDEEVLEVDSLVNGFLRSLDPKVLKRTVIVLFSDHGEMFAKHGRFGRLGNVRGVLFDDVARVPLIMRFPGGPSRRVAALAQLIDVMPTLLGALDIPMPPGRQGVDLSSAIASGAEPNRYAYAGASYGPHPAYYPFWSENDMVRDGRWKLIEESTFRVPFPIGKKDSFEFIKETAALYGLDQDPQELRDVSAEHPDVAADLREKLSAWKQATKGFSSEPPATREFPKEMLEKARKRGYW